MIERYETEPPTNLRPLRAAPRDGGSAEKRIGSQSGSRWRVAYPRMIVGDDRRLEEIDELDRRHDFARRSFPPHPKAASLQSRWPVAVDMPRSAGGPGTGSRRERLRASRPEMAP